MKTFLTFYYDGRREPVETADIYAYLLSRPEIESACSLLHVETSLANEAYDGFQHCLTCTEEAGRSLEDAVDDLLAMADMEETSEAEAKSLQLVSSTFVECDSTRSHGSCYFDLAFTCSPELEARLEEADIRLELQSHTGD